MKNNKKRNLLKDNIKTIITVFLGIIIVTFIMLYNNFFNSKKIYTVVNGCVEKISDTYLYVLKQENVINIDENIVAIPIIEQDKRASKGEVVAVYKNSNYDKYQEEISSLDKEIQLLIKDLPAIYSSDINMIDIQISDLVKEAQNENSYVKMQEYKNNVNDLLYKKINILGQLSPAGSKIRELIEQREKLDQDSKNSSNNIKAPVAGLVTYKIDGLETLIDFDNILNYDVNKYEEIINKYKDNSINNFGIKIVNNFKCYYLEKEVENENNKYIKEGRNYKIKLMDKSSSDSTSAVLEKSITSNGYTYNLFSIENSISDVLDSREIGAEIIWTKEEGMVVPNESIKNINDINYVTLVTGGEYIDIPIKVVISNDTISIVENYTSDEKIQYGINCEYILERYDQLLIENKNS